MSPIPLSLPGNVNNYVLYKGTLWSSRKKLQLADCQFLIEKLLSAEAVKLDRASDLIHSRNRLTIPASVRHAVWRRDQGKCTRCGSRERLEYDHIIPVSLGGGYTEGNIELLCEACNRAKRDSLAL